ncbi:sulfatase [Phragmitibacter flavus]|uniref:Sulfatase n=1 Tax=Phragmitibacter flavus TaxID=2576071 RepID=A0A5R8KBD1_9BACT|nr:sulfatase [Phragmitibacter flavus]TLD69623.1 sulfatase [Phragmitibacter flavus]
MKIFLLGLMMLTGSLLHGAERPNVVFLLVDDWRWNAAGFMGDKIVKTPHMDALAKEGVVFENAFVTTSICSVSRASILTGQWERRHGIVDFKTGLTDAQWAETYPGLMRKAGYRTGFVGKYGVGDVKATEERGASFDFWRGQAGQGTKFFIEPGDSTRKHATARYGDEALEFLQGVEKGQPFCLSVSFSAVHARDGQATEFEPDPRDEDLYSDVEIPLPVLATEEAFAKVPEFVKTSEGRRRWEWRFDEAKKAQGILKDYYRLVTGVDREVGRLREVLRERGLAENTVVVVTSDNGYALGDRGLADKWFMWEEDIRVPLVVYDPRLEEGQRGRRLKEMVLNVDLAPTMLERVGIEVPKGMQGRSLVPLVSGESVADWRGEFFYEHHVLPGRIPPVEGVRTDRWKYIRWMGSDPLVEELYDLESDPLEQRNLVGVSEHAEMLEELRGKWREYGERLR